MIILKGRVLDGNGGQPIEKGAVVLEGNRIVLVCRQSELPEYPNAQVYTLPEGTIMPGLIDAHVHMGWGSATSVDWISMTPQLSMARALRDMAQLRQQGYTAFRDLGSDVIRPFSHPDRWPRRCIPEAVAGRKPAGLQPRHYRKRRG